MRAASTHDSHVDVQCWGWMDGFNVSQFSAWHGMAMVMAMAMWLYGRFAVVVYMNGDDDDDDDDDDDG